MNFFTKVERDKAFIFPLGDLEEMRKFQLLLIDYQCYGQLKPSERNKIMHHVREIEIHLKENFQKAVKKEFAVKPIKIFERSKETNHQYYERHKNRKDGTTTDSTGLSEGILEEL
jgi:hypothetical protein